MVSYGMVLWLSLNTIASEKLDLLTKEEMRKSNNDRQIAKLVVILIYNTTTLKQ